ncbi:zinc-binding alcohol dehydrogenase family protein [Croceicoccus ponticola]|uniref:Zinc-binding alcohol dehydrogenase family protein n=1 Tax=Croceicoccus ponticola TaxID=2217664 RepID=A0A437GTX7_9SPHN|nr:zinc-binding alcohol dehydrogenase family protein [Croceicoccus ponticola]RVQ64597.1 zinc-binding alcohol dehydrogenase family protein [Croceicoccus ponticola]
MKAVFYSENGGPEVMAYGDHPDPQVSDNTVLIRNEAISIEGGDLLNRLLSPPAEVPFVPGYQAAGIVEDVGKDVTRFRPGQRVVAFNWNGSHAELFASPEHYTYGIPDALDTLVAAAAPIAFGTAHDALITYGHVQPGETVLIQGAAGGVGIAAIQIAKEAGAIVIGTSSSAARLDELRSYGLDHGINYRDEDIAARCLDLTGGKGVDLALDLAGGKGKDLLVKALRPHGRYAAVGASTGEIPSFSFFELIGERLVVYGVSLGQEMHTDRVRNLVDTVLAKLVEGVYRMPIDRVFGLSEAVEAHRFVANGHPFGRVMLSVGAR